MLKAILLSICAVVHLGAALPHSGRIIGGAQASPGQFPYLVSLQSASSRSHFCGGGLISERLILTAAHCFADNRNPANSVAYVGTTDNTSGGTYYTLSRVVVNENFSSTRLINDVCLLQTTNPVQLGPSVGILKLPSPGLNIPGNTKVTATGWGTIRYPNQQYPKQLYFVELGVVPNADCSRDLGSSIVDGQICVGGENGKGLCYGDSGSPLILNGDTTVGIVSWGEPCAVGYPDVFTRVSSYIDWIQTNSALLESLE